MSIDKIFEALASGPRRQILAYLLSSLREGQFVRYRLNRDHLANNLTGFVFELCPVAGPLKKESRALAKSRKPAGETK